MFEGTCSLGKQDNIEMWIINRPINNKKKLKNGKTFYEIANTVNLNWIKLINVLVCQLGMVQPDIAPFICRHSTDREVALMMLMAYLSYMVAEVINHHLQKCILFLFYFLKKNKFVCNG